MQDLRFQDFMFDATPAHFQAEQRAIEEIRLIVVDAVTIAVQTCAGQSFVTGPNDPLA